MDTQATGTQTDKVRFSSVPWETMYSRWKVEIATGFGLKILHVGNSEAEAKKSALKKLQEWSDEVSNFLLAQGSQFYRMDHRVPVATLTPKEQADIRAEFGWLLGVLDAYGTMAVNKSQHTAIDEEARKVLKKVAGLLGMETE